ncbi:phage tail tape measure protein [Vibrio metschnikovii]|nr:phage tail tape measure protein [Vibrio metschnikovii]
MAQQLKTDIILNLAGNLAAKAKQYGASMNDFARNNERAMTLVKRTTAAAGRGIDSLGNRYVGLGASLVTGIAARNFATLDRRLSRIAIAADITRDKAKELFQVIENISNQKGIVIDSKEPLAALEEILTKTGDLDYAMRNMPSIATVIGATGASGQAVGGVFTEFKKLNIEDAEEAFAAIDTLNMQGKSGAFPLKSFAELGPRIFAAYAATGRQGVEAVTELGAALQVIRGGSGSDEQAVTSFEGLIRDLTNPENVERLKQYGRIDVFDPEKLKDGVEVMRPLPDLMTEIMVRSHGLSKNLKMLQLSDVSTKALSVLKAEMSQTGDVKAFEKFMEIAGDGSVTIADAAVASSDFQASIQLLNNAFSKFANERLAEPIQQLADAINSVDDETIQNWLKWGETALWVVGGLVAAKKGLDMAASIKSVFGKTPGTGGVSGGFSDLGVMPVYVVNMPGGGMGGEMLDGLGGDGKPTDKPRRKPKPPKNSPKIFSIKNLAMLSTIGYGVSIAPEFSPIEVRRASEVDRSELPESFPVQPGLLDVWDDIRNWFSSDNSKSNSDNNTSNARNSIIGMQPSEMKLKVEVSDDRVKVTPSYLPPGFKIDPDTGIN